jgi:hypothetical protein
MLFAAKYLAYEFLFTVEIEALFFLTRAFFPKVIHLQTTLTHAFCTTGWAARYRWFFLSGPP